MREGQGTRLSHVDVYRCVSQQRNLEHINLLHAMLHSRPIIMLGMPTKTSTSTASHLVELIYILRILLKIDGAGIPVIL